MQIYELENKMLFYIEICTLGQFVTYRLTTLFFFFLLSY